MIRVFFTSFSLLFFVLIIGLLPAKAEDAPSARTIVQEAVDYWRGESSYAEARMLIHRPGWERSMGFKGWTLGEKLSLVRFTAPAKDAGNASLTNDTEMWSYSPKINKTIKIPPSMMSQSWMGSDFSHSDLAKQRDVVEKYDHSLVSTEVVDGKKVYTIESIPHEDAAVVWGKEVFRIREDHLIIERSFFDQDLKLVKKLISQDFLPSGTRFYAKTVRMQKAENPEEWTEVIHDTMKFAVDVKESMFTLSNLANARE